MPIRQAIRRCVACRKEASKNRLVRVVMSEGQLSLDLAGTAAGRGAYLHLEAACLWRRGAGEAVRASLLRYDKEQLGKLQPRSRASGGTKSEISLLDLVRVALGTKQVGQAGMAWRKAEFRRRETLRGLVERESASPHKEAGILGSTKRRKVLL